MCIFIIMVDTNSEADRVVKQIEDRFAHELETVRELLALQDIMPNIGTFRY